MIILIIGIILLAIESIWKPRVDFYTTQHYNIKQNHCVLHYNQLWFNVKFRKPFKIF